VIKHHEIEHTKEPPSTPSHREYLMVYLKNFKLYLIIMECGICYSEIKDNKLFRACSCSFNMCIDCVKQGEIKKCPQCNESYKWIMQDIDVNFKIMVLNTKIEVMGDTLRYYKDICERDKNKIKQLQNKLNELTEETMIKSQYMEQMSNTIIKLIKDKEEEELINDVQDVVNRLNLIP
jgi:hypothetical protein